VGEILQFSDECWGVVSAVLHTFAHAISGAELGAGSIESVGLMLDVEDVLFVEVPCLLGCRGCCRQHISGGKAGGIRRRRAAHGRGKLRLLLALTLLGICHRGQK
jgi:hypothetical protein